MKKRILVINNDTGAIKEIKESLKKESFKIVHFTKIKPNQTKGFTHIILTGGGHRATLKKFAEEIKLTKNSEVPLLGICLGMQLIGRAFGSSLRNLDEEKTGNNNVKILKEDNPFDKLPGILCVYEHHEHALNKIGKDQDFLTSSKDCVEAIKHKTKRICGVQFHSEVIHEGKKDGRKVIKRLLAF